MGFLRAHSSLPCYCPLAYIHTHTISYYFLYSFLSLPEAPFQESSLSLRLRRRATLTSSREIQFWSKVSNLYDAIKLQNSKHHKRALKRQKCGRRPCKYPGMGQFSSLFFSPKYLVQYRTQNMYISTTRMSIA